MLIQSTKKGCAGRGSARWEYFDLLSNFTSAICIVTGYDADLAWWYTEAAATLDRGRPILQHSTIDFSFVAAETLPHNSVGGSFLRGANGSGRKTLIRLVTLAKSSIPSLLAEYI